MIQLPPDKREPKAYCQLHHTKSDFFYPYSQLRTLTLDTLQFFLPNSKNNILKMYLLTNQWKKITKICPELQTAAYTHNYIHLHTVKLMKIIVFFFKDKFRLG